MSNVKKPLLFTALLLLPIAVTTIGIRLYLAKTGMWMDRYQDGRVIPVTGLKLNPNGLTNLQGDAKDDFRRLVGAIRAYADKYQRFPDDPRWLIEFTKKWILPWRQWANKNSGLGTAHNHFFAIEFVAFEFFWRCIAINHNQFYFKSYAKWFLNHLRNVNLFLCDLLIQYPF
mgnify:CR=1 FL=1